MWQRIFGLAGALAVGCPSDRIEQGLKTFKALPHRLEKRHAAGGGLLVAADDHGDLARRRRLRTRRRHRPRGPRTIRGSRTRRAGHCGRLLRRHNSGRLGSNRLNFRVPYAAIIRPASQDESVQIHRLEQGCPTWVHQGAPAPSSGRRRMRRHAASSGPDKAKPPDIASKTNCGCKAMTTKNNGTRIA